MYEYQPLLEKLEYLSGDEPLGPVEDELFQWFLFAYTGKGHGIKDFNQFNFAAFKDHLTLIIDTIYQWHQDKN